MSYREPSIADRFASYRSRQSFPVAAPVQRLEETCDGSPWWEEMRRKRMEDVTRVDADDTSEWYGGDEPHRQYTAATVVVPSNLPKFPYPGSFYADDSFNTVMTDSGLFVFPTA